MILPPTPTQSAFIQSALALLTEFKFEKKLRCVVVVAASSILWSCSAARTTTQQTAQSSAPTSTTAASTALLTEGMAKRAIALVALKAEGTLAAAVKSSRQRVQFEGHLYRRDSLFITLYGPFGITVGKLQSVPKFAQFYFAIDNSLYEGEPTRQNFSKLGVPISFDEVTTFLRGEIPGGTEGFAPTPHTKDGEEAFVRHKDTTVERLTYSKQSQAVLEYTMESTKGEQIMNVKCGNFAPAAGVNIAQEIIMQFPSSDATLNIQCSSIEANPANARYTFVLPAGATRKKF